MKSLEFRFWDKKLKEMNYLSLSDLSEDNYWFDGETSVWSVLHDSMNEQERFLCMPYAYRIDKQNQKIFEYDVVKIGENTFALVVFVEEKCAFMLYYNNQYVPLTILDTMEVVGVVGNILINPELNTFNLNV